MDSGLLFKWGIPMLANKMFRRLSHNPGGVQALVRCTWKCNSSPDQLVASARPSVVYQGLVVVGKKGKLELSSGG